MISLYMQSQQSLIGEILCDAKKILIDVMSEPIMPEDFSILDCRHIYEACIELFAKGESIDALTVLNQVKGDRAQMKVYMYSLVESVVSMANYKEHIRIVKKSAILERAKKRCSELYNAIGENEEFEVCREKSAEILKEFDGTGTSEIITSRAGCNKFLENIGKKKEYITTGIAKLDKYIKISKGDFIVVGGRPSTGKTALTLQLMLNMSKRYKVMYFSLETSTEKLFERIIANYTKTSFSEIQCGGLSSDKIEKIRGSCYNELEDLEFSIVNASGWTVEQIISKSLQAKADVIYVDYLGLIKSNSGKSQYEKVTQISLDLHTAAMKNKMAIVALVQLNRTAQGQPDMSSLRDSGQIEQDADAILLLDTPDESEDYENIKRLTIAKNKTGLIGTIEFDFNGEYQMFSVIENGYQ